MEVEGGIVDSPHHRVQHVHALGLHGITVGYFITVLMPANPNPPEVGTKSLRLKP